MSKGYVKRSVSKKPASKPNYRTLKGLAAAVVLGAAAYGLFHYAKSNPSSSAYVANEVSSRQHFLEDIAKDLPIPYMSSITYDPTGELLYNTQLTLAQKVHHEMI
jgi:hypothetical protein